LTRRLFFFGLVSSSPSSAPRVPFGTKSVRRSPIPSIAGSW